MRTFLIKAIVAHGKIDANGPGTDIVAAAGLTEI
jgi:hypothetical protein